MDHAVSTIRVNDGPFLHLPQPQNLHAQFIDRDKVLVFLEHEPLALRLPELRRLMPKNHELLVQHRNIEAHHIISVYENAFVGDYKFLMAFLLIFQDV